MADEWHVKWLQEGVTRWNKRRRKVDFSPDLSGLKFYDLLPPDFRDDPKTSRYFERIDLSTANLSNANLSNLNFSKANFEGADMSSADMSKSNFSQAKFKNTELSGATAYRSIFEGTLFERSRLSRMSFVEVTAEEATFIDSDLSSTQLAELGEATVKIFDSRASFDDAVTRSELHFESFNKRLLRTPGNIDDRIPKNKYDVFFGTNRYPIFERGALVDFDGRKSDDLTYGICEVIVPDGHRIGSLGSPLWKRLKNKSDDRLRIDNLVALNQELFFEHLRQTTEAMKVPERPTIFIHGFNNTFEAAVLRAAQIGYDLGLGQGIGLFSWPSKGKASAYSADEATVDVSKYFLADFIEDFVKNAFDQSVNIIAHSMGTRCLLGALEILSNGRQDTLGRINQLILAAADVDAAVMPFLGRHAVDNCTRTTSYVSDKDKALKVSKWLHSFPRVGVRPPTFVLSGMDTVIVNNLDLGDFSHGYVATSRTILADMFQLLQSNLSPSQRFSIISQIDAGNACWRLKD